MGSAHLSSCSERLTFPCSFFLPCLFLSYTGQYLSVCWYSGLPYSFSKALLPTMWLLDTVGWPPFQLTSNRTDFSPFILHPLLGSCKDLQFTCCEVVVWLFGFLIVIKLFSGFCPSIFLLMRLSPKKGLQFLAYHLITTKGLLKYSENRSTHISLEPPLSYWKCWFIGVPRLCTEMLPHEAETHVNSL